MLKRNLKCLPEGIGTNNCGKKTTGLVGAAVSGL